MITTDAKKGILKSIYAGLGGLAILGILNQIGAYQQNQTFRDTATEFMKTERDRNDKQDVTNSLLQTTVAVQQEELKSFDRRLTIMETKK